MAFEVEVEVLLCRGSLEAGELELERKNYELIGLGWEIYL